MYAKHATRSERGSLRALRNICNQICTAATLAARNARVRVVTQILCIVESAGDGINSLFLPLGRSHSLFNFVGGVIGRSRASNAISDVRSRAPPWKRRWLSRQFGSTRDQSTISNPSRPFGWINAIAQPHFPCRYTVFVRFCQIGIRHLRTQYCKVTARWRHHWIFN
jgi:hypothetical protein